MTVSKVPLIPPVINLKGLKISLHEKLIIEEQINGEGKVKKENSSLIILKNVGRKYQIVFLLIIVFYKKIKMKLNQSLQRSQLWIQIFKNKPMIYLRNFRIKILESLNQYQVY